MRRLSGGSSLRGLPIVAASVMLAWTACALGQTVTFGGPVVGGEATTQVGGVISSFPILGVKSPGGIATDKLGTFYVTDNEGNAVYSFTQPVPGGTLVSTQMKFSGLNSPGAIAVDSGGDVYVADNDNDRIVELTAGGTQVPIPVPQSGYPIGLAVDASGNLYFSAGFAYNNPGAVFKLAAGSKTPAQIGTGLVDPKGLAVDPAGNLFIADYDNERIVEISASGKQTTALTLNNSPFHIAVDSKDDIFTDGGSNDDVIEIKAGQPDQVAVLPQVIVSFSGLTVDGDGNLFAVQGIAGDGAGPTFYESSTQVISLPPANVCQPGGNPASGCSSTQSLVFAIWNSVNLGAPRLLTQGTPGLDFTDGGSSQNSAQQGIPQPCVAGAINLPSNAYQTCSVTVKFSPLAAGPRRGALQIVDSSGNVLLQLLLYGMGNGPQLAIAPDGAPPVTATIPVAPGNQTLTNVAADAAGNVFVTASLGGTNNYTSSVYRIDPSGNQAVIPIANVFDPGRVAIDGAGNLFLPAAYADYEFSPSGSTVAPPPLIASIHGGPQGLSLDMQGNATLVTDNFGLGTGVVYRSTLDGSLIPIASSSTSDSFGDVVDDPWVSGVDTGLHYDVPIVAEGANLVEASPFAQAFEPFLDLQSLNGSFSIPQGSGTLDIGPNGDIYFTNGDGIYDTSGNTRFIGSESFAIDDSGSLLAVIPASGFQYSSVVRVPAIQQPFAFPAAAVNSSGPAQKFTISNSGNAEMTFASIAVSGPFAVTGNTCGASLDPGTSCSVSVAFQPTAAGAATGSLNVAVAGLVTPTFALTGKGNATAPLIATTTTLTASPNPAASGTAVNLTVTVAATSGTPTGTVAVEDAGNALAQITLSSGGGSYSAASLAAGTHTLTAVYSGDGNNQPSTSSPVTLVISPVAAAVAPTTPTTVSAGGSVSANVSITPASGFSGTVSLACAVAFQGQGSAASPPACAVNPSSVSLSAGGAGSATLTVTTTAQSTASNAVPGGAALACAAFLILFSRRRFRVLLLMLLVCVAPFAISGCSPNNTTPTPPPAPPPTAGTTAGAYAVTLSTTAGSVTTAQTFTINVE